VIHFTKREQKSIAQFRFQILSGSQEIVEFITHQDYGILINGYGLLAEGESYFDIDLDLGGE
jgi:hypothetical protein